MSTKTEEKLEDVQKIDLGLSAFNSKYSSKNKQIKNRHLKTNNQMSVLCY